MRNKCIQNDIKTLCFFVFDFKMSVSKPKRQHTDRTLKEKIEILGKLDCGLKAVDVCKVPFKAFEWVLLTTRAKHPALQNSSFITQQSFVSGLTRKFMTSILTSYIPSPQFCLFIDDATRISKFEIIFRKIFKKIYLLREVLCQFKVLIHY